MSKDPAVSEVASVLMREWDPVGVFGVDAETDEYDPYAERICSMLQDGASSDELKEYISNVQIEWFGITTPITKHLIKGLVLIAPNSSS